MRYIHRELRHFLKRSTFWLSVSVVLFCFFFEHRDYLSFYFAGETLYHLDVFYLFVTPFEYGLFFYLVPLAAIPTAAFSVVDELKSGHVRLKLYRSSENGYILRRLVSISFASILPMLTGCLIFLCFSMLIGPFQGENGLSIQESCSAVMQALVTANSGITYIVYITVQAMLFSWVWGLLGTLIALITLNKGVTLMDGFLLFWGCDCLCNYLHFSSWRPYILFFTSPTSTLSPWSSWWKTALLLCLFTAMDALLLRRRYRQL